jgi:hypothetical protein
MKYIPIIITLILASCGGSRKTKVCEGMIISKIVPSTHDYEEKYTNYCKYFAHNGTSLWREFKFIDTCGKFTIGDTVYPKFVKYE